MTVNAESLELTRLEWDSSFFRFNVGKVLSAGEKVECSHALDAMKREGFDLAYWPSPQSLPACFNRFFIVNQTTFEKPIAESFSQSKESEFRVEIYPQTLANDELKQLAFIAGWSSRFRIDPRIPNERFEELYATWINRSCLREIADSVLVAIAQNELAGFVTLKNVATTSTIGLIAVKPKFQGKGIASALLTHCENLASRIGANVLRVVTQANNISATALYRKHGMRQTDQQNWYHLWRNSLES